MVNNFEQGNGHKVAGTQGIYKEEANEIIVQKYWPDDIANALYDAEMTAPEATELVSYELSCIYADITDVFEGNYSNAREVIEDALDMVREFLDIADEYGLRIGNWAYNWYSDDMAKFHKIAC